MSLYIPVFVSRLSAAAESRRLLWLLKLYKLVWAGNLLLHEHGEALERRYRLDF
jgi:hypothetical protein